MKKKNILISSLLVTLISFFIKALGLIKQSVLAAVCGATTDSDIFFVSTGIISQLAIAIFSAISISLLTSYTRKTLDKGENDANNLINSALRLFLPIATLLATVFCLLAEPLTFLIAPSFSESEKMLLAGHLRVMSIAFIPWCYYLIVNVTLESHKIFLPGRLQGLFQNVFIIIAAVFLYTNFGVSALVVSFLVSGVIQSITVTICAHRYFHFSFKKTGNWELVKRILILSIPLIVGNAVYEINDIVDKQLSLGLGDGYASILAYGGTINEIVTGIVVGSVSIVLFANFVDQVANNKIDELTQSIYKSIEALTAIIIPIMVMCLVCGDKLIAVLYGRGNFGSEQITLTYYVLIGYAIGFVFQSLRSVFSKVLYAFEDTKSPMINGIIAIAVNITLSIVLSRFIGIFGIALATSISIILVTILLYISVKKRLPSLNIKPILLELCKFIIGGIFASIVLFFIKYYLPKIIIYFEFLIEGFSCIIVYVGALLLLKSKTLLGLFKRKHNKDNII